MLSITKTHSGGNIMRFISNEHSMNSKETIVLSMLKLYITSIDMKRRKQWKQKIMQRRNEEILINGNSLLTLLESAKSCAVVVLEEKQKEQKVVAVEKVLGYVKNVEFYETVNNASDVFVKAIVDIFSDLEDGDER